MVVPAEQRATKSAERCDLHPGSASVARCDGCGRPMCLSCAVPVRGRVFGAECLQDAIGPDAPVDSVAPARPARAAWTAVGAGFAVATVAAILPWTRFGDGSTAFGAWALSARWSMLAAPAAVAGVLAWVFLWIRGDRGGIAGGAVLVVLAGLEAVGGGFAIANPPPFTAPAGAAWIALSGGLAATLGALALVARSLRGR